MLTGFKIQIKMQNEEILVMALTILDEQLESVQLSVEVREKALQKSK